MFFSNLRLTIDDFTAYPQVNVFTTTCGSFSESKPEPHHATGHVILKSPMEEHMVHDPLRHPPTDMIKHR